LAEGADVIMVKPSSFYSDIIAEARELAQDVPVATYQVSGEYAMICAAAKAGVFDLRRMAEEALEGCLRAGISQSQVNLISRGSIRSELFHATGIGLVK
jgi:porphobilinogen synthase